MNLPEKPMTKVYVCSPFRPVSIDPKEAEKEKQRNINLAKNACELVVKLGFVPIAPHLYFPQFLDDGNPEEREKGMMLGRELLCGCNELWVFGDRISEGMKAEIGQAKASDIPVRYCNAPEKFTARMLEVCEAMMKRHPMGMVKDIISLIPKVTDETGMHPCAIYMVLDELVKVCEKEAYHDK